MVAGSFFSLQSLPAFPVRTLGLKLGKGEEVVAFSSDASVLITSRAGDAVLVWDLRKARCRAPIQIQQGDSVVLAPDD
jgi:hypothetical protein